MSCNDVLAASVSIIARNARRLNQLSVLRAFNSDGPDLVQKIAKELDIPRQPEPSSDTATQTAKSASVAAFTSVHVD